MNKKGFTLIELLAIIVILAIIAVITVPLILGIIDNAKEKAVMDSAYGYKDAVNKFYATELLKNKDYKMEEGVYTVAELNTEGLSVSGQEPESNSWIQIENNNVKLGCLIFNGYEIKISNDSVSNPEKGNCKFATQVTKNGVEDLNVGDLICIDSTDQCFNVISNKDGITTMLSQYNLNVGDEKNTQVQEGIQNESVRGFNNTATKYGTNIFLLTSQSNYYWGDIPNTYAYNENSGLYIYVQNYKDYLVNQGALLKDVRLLKYDEAISDEIGCDEVSRKCPTKSSFIYQTSFWLGSSANAQSIYSIYFDGGFYSNEAHSLNLGVRPVIEIPSESINLRS